MQYILTEKEYQEIVEYKEKELKEKDDIINKLCQDVCNYKPITGDWGKWEEEPNKHPWGCIHSQDEEWYCDECPVQDYCSLPHNWSQ